VPTHLFKVIRLTERSGAVYAAAFVIANRPIVDSKSLQDFLMPISFVETSAGLNLEGLKSNNDLCRRVDCSRRREIRLVRAWRSYARIQVATTLAEIAPLVSHALQGSYFDAVNPQLIDLVSRRVREFSSLPPEEASFYWFHPRRAQLRDVLVEIRKYSLVKLDRTKR